MKSLLEKAKYAYWFCTDKQWRAQYQSSRNRITSLAAARKEASDAIWKYTNGGVASGPFAGMAYLRNWKNIYFTQKLLGTYEKELHDIVKSFHGFNFDTIIDIGAAEGYYACGLAYMLPGAKVLAFESQRCLHPAVRKIAAANGLEGRVQLGGACEVTKLNAALAASNRALVVMDVDGAEQELLCPKRVPMLRDVDILVETHDRIVPGISAQIRERFHQTHRIQEVWQQARTEEDIPPGLPLPTVLAVKAMNECRGEGNDWLWMQANGES